MKGKTRAGILGLAVVAVAACQRSTERTDGPAEAWPESAPNITPLTPAAATEADSSFTLEPDGQSFRVKVAERLQAPLVRLGGTAAAPFQLRLASAPGFFLEVAQEGARAVTARIDRKLLRYANALGPGTEMLLRPTTSGVEDYVRFDQDPGTPRLDYRVTLGPEVRGLHLINGNLEFLDAEGAPRLRVNAPYGVDAKGQRFEASLTVVGCAVDLDPRLPWGRPVTAPGASSCMVHVSWARDVRYPALVDPAWVGTTNDMGLATNTHEVPTALLSTGRVLAAPAAGSTQSFVFDPNTATWATVASAIPFAWQHRARMVGATNGRAWLTAGNTSSTAMYDANTNQWTATTALPGTLSASEGVGLAHHNGDTIIVVGSNGTTHAYNLTTKAYTARTSANRSWGQNTGAVKLSADRIVVTGNSNAGLYGVYDMSADKWTLLNTPVNNIEHSCVQLAPLSNGHMLAYGSPSCSGTNWARVFDPLTDQVVAIPNMPAAPSVRCLCSRTSHASYGTRHLIAGGRLQFDEESPNNITDLGVVPGYPDGADVPGSIVKLFDGRALAVGSTNGNPQTSKTALYGPSVAGDCPQYSSTPTNPSTFDALKKVCTPQNCDGDFGGVTAARCPTARAPLCVSGTCLGCEKGHGVPGGRQCPAVRPACLSTGVCEKANGDQGSNATRPCPQSSAPFAKNDGSCGKCAATQECLDTQGGTIARTGTICNSNTGACGSACAIDVDCPALQYCVDTGADGGAGAKSCSPKKADGESCTAPRECAKNVCLAGVCGVPVSDAGVADASGSMDATTDATPNAGDSAAGPAVADAGAAPEEAPRGPEITAAPVASAPTADDGCQIGPTRGGGAPWQTWLVAAITLGWCLRRRRASAT